MIKVWDTETGSCVHDLNAHTNGIFSIKMTGDANTFASIGMDKTIKIWDARMQDNVATIESNGGSAQMNDLSLTAEFGSGKNLASVGFNDGRVTTWDLNT